MATIETKNRQNLIEGNDQYVVERRKKFKKLLPTPEKHYLIVTCMDARIDTLEGFGMDLGEAHVVRNAGGSAVAALRDIIISHHLLGTKEVFIIKHHDCEMKNLTADGDILSQLYPGKIKCPGAASIQGMDFHTIACPYGATRADWWFLQNHPAVADDLIIHGFVFDPATGKVDDVSPGSGDPNAAPGSQPNPPPAAPPGAPAAEPPALDDVNDDDDDADSPEPSPPSRASRRHRTPPRTVAQSVAKKTKKRKATEEPATVTISAEGTTKRRKRAAASPAVAPRKKRAAPAKRSGAT